MVLHDTIFGAMYSAMPKIDISKKPASQDWHRADIKAALEKAGWTLRRLSAAHGYQPKSISLVLHRPWPAAERIVADAIGESPQAIWPSRYHADGTPKSGRGERGIGRYKAKNTSRASPCNGNSNGTDRQGKGNGAHS